MQELERAREREEWHRKLEELSAQHRADLSQQYEILLNQQSAEVSNVSNVSNHSYSERVVVGGGEEGVGEEGADGESMEHADPRAHFTTARAHFTTDGDSMEHDDALMHGAVLGAARRQAQTQIHELALLQQEVTVLEEEFSLLHQELEATRAPEERESAVRREGGGGGDERGEREKVLLLEVKTKANSRTHQLQAAEARVEELEQEKLELDHQLRQLHQRISEAPVALVSQMRRQHLVQPQRGLSEGMLVANGDSRDLRELVSQLQVQCAGLLAEVVGMEQLKTECALAKRETKKANEKGDLTHLLLKEKERAFQAQRRKLVQDHERTCSQKDRLIDSQCELIGKLCMELGDLRAKWGRDDASPGVCQLVETHDRLGGQVVLQQLGPGSEFGSWVHPHPPTPLGSEGEADTDTPVAHAVKAQAASASGIHASTQTQVVRVVLDAQTGAIRALDNDVLESQHAVRDSSISSPPLLDAAAHSIYREHILPAHHDQGVMGPGVAHTLCAESSWDRGVTGQPDAQQSSPNVGRPTILGALLLELPPKVQREMSTVISASLGVGVGGQGGREEQGRAGGEEKGGGGSVTLNTDEEERRELCEEFEKLQRMVEEVTANEEVLRQLGLLSLLLVDFWSRSNVRWSWSNMQERPLLQAVTSFKTPHVDQAAVVQLVSSLSLSVAGTLRAAEEALTAADAAVDDMLVAVRELRAHEHHAYGNGGVGAGKRVLLTERYTQTDRLAGVEVWTQAKVVGEVEAWTQFEGVGEVEIGTQTDGQTGAEAWTQVEAMVGVEADKVREECTGGIGGEEECGIKDKEVQGFGEDGENVFGAALQNLRQRLERVHQVICTPKKAHVGDIGDIGGGGGGDVAGAGGGGAAAAAICTLKKTHAPTRDRERLQSAALDCTGTGTVTSDLTRANSVESVESPWEVPSVVHAKRRLASKETYDAESAASKETYDIESDAESSASKDTHHTEWGKAPGGGGESGDELLECNGVGVGGGYTPQMKVDIGDLGEKADILIHALEGGGTREAEAEIPPHTYEEEAVDIGDIGAGYTPEMPDDPAGDGVGGGVRDTPEMRDDPAALMQEEKRPTLEPKETYNANPLNERLPQAEWEGSSEAERLMGSRGLGGMSMEKLCDEYGLAQYWSVMQENDIDLDIAHELTSDDWRELGVEQQDLQQLLRAILIHAPGGGTREAEAEKKYEEEAVDGAEEEDAEQDEDEDEDEDEDPPAYDAVVQEQLYQIDTVLRGRQEVAANKGSCESGGDEGGESGGEEGGLWGDMEWASGENVDEFVGVEEEFVGVEEAGVSPRPEGRGGGDGGGAGEGEEGGGYEPGGDVDDDGEVTLGLEGGGGERESDRTVLAKMRVETADIRSSSSDIHSSSSSQQHPVLSLPRQAHVPKEVASAAAGAAGGHETTPAGEGDGEDLEAVSGKTGVAFRVQFSLGDLVQFRRGMTGAA
jgi:hypothetical protein